MPSTQSQQLFIFSQWFIICSPYVCLGFPGAANGKDPACQCRRLRKCGFDPWVRMIPWRRARQPAPVFLPGESHGQKSLAGDSPWGHKESDTAERLNTAAARVFMRVYIFFSGIFSEGQTSCSSILKYSHVSFIRTRTFSYVIIVHLSIRKLSSGATLLYNLHLTLRFQELSQHMLFRSSFLGILLCYSLSHVWLFSTPWIVTSQVSLSMGFSRQEYWSGLPFPSPGNLPKLGSPALLLDSLLPELPPWIHTIALIPVPALQDSL